MRQVTPAHIPARQVTRRQVTKPQITRAALDPRPVPGEETTGEVENE